MIIVSAGDNKFVPGMMVLIYSAWINNRDAQFYVVDAGISPEGRGRLLAFCRAHGISCSIVQVDPRLLARLPASANWSSAMYARLFIPDLLSEHSRAIYIDGDAVVNSDISELWHLDLGNNLVAGVLDGLMRPAFLNQIGLRAEQYINSGVLVMNLDRWRAEQTGNKTIQLLLSRPNLKFPDQTAINLVARDRILYIDRKFNFFAREYTHFPKMTPRIIHYAGPDKPWNNQRSPLAEIFDAYREVSGSDIPKPSRGWQFKTFRRTIMGLLSLRPKYWRQLDYRLHYQSKFIVPHIRELRARAGRMQGTEASRA
ncbi:glycosyltransferase family 8 protein [Kaistia granuli]|uniref:glycosyltransferase family 8 protein n=1 Tax=Kaistia granuli TaxID=363259 RepID=UPI0003707182|nr:glycosyltransferase family 8 protein [Kaistia granuli]